MSISVVQGSWVKCSELLLFSDVLLVLSRYGCMFCILLFPSLIYVFLLSCLCIIVMNALLSSYPA